MGTFARRIAVLGLVFGGILLVGGLYLFVSGGAAPPEPASADSARQPTSVVTPPTGQNGTPVADDPVRSVEPVTRFPGATPTPTPTSTSTPVERQEESTTTATLPSGERALILDTINQTHYKILLSDGTRQVVSPKGVREPRQSDVASVADGEIPSNVSEWWSQSEHDRETWTLRAVQGSEVIITVTEGSATTNGTLEGYLTLASGPFRGETVGSLLIEQGYAVSVDQGFEKRSSYRELEADAKSAGRGVWALLVDESTPSTAR